MRRRIPITSPRNAELIGRMAQSAERRRYNSERKGGYPPRWRDEMGKAQRWKCAYCRCLMTAEDYGNGKVATFDHLTPLSRGGKTRRENLVLACITCNQAKGSMTEVEYRATLIEDDCA